MGQLLVQESGGHVAIGWDENSINIHLNPVEGKASRGERDHVLKLVKQCLDKGFSVKVDGTLVTGSIEIPKQAKHIVLQVEVHDIQQLVSNLLGSKELSNHVLFKLDDNGQGELIQKSSFVADTSNYATTVPLAGG